MATGEIAKELEIADKNRMRLSLLNSLILAFSVAACGDSSHAPAPGSDDSAPGEADAGNSGGSDKAPVAGRDAGQASSSGSSGSGSTMDKPSSGSSGSTTGNGTTVSVGTVAKDGGQVTVVSGSTDGGAADDSLAGFGDIFGSDSDGGTPQSSSNADGGTAGSCEDAVCFDVFDCAVWHLDSLDCGFTACENFVCVK